MKKTVLSIIVACTLSFLVAASASAAVRESTNYKLLSDSVTGGGERTGTSTNYSLDDSIGDLAAGKSTSTNYTERAVARSLTAGTIAVSSPGDASFTPLTLTQNTAVTNVVWNVESQGSAGYTATVKASTVPALRNSVNGKTFANYTEATTGTRETWSVGSAYEFGFSAFGTSTVGFGSDADCVAGADVPSTGLLWQGFNGTSTTVIASSTSATGSGGINTTLCLATEQSSVFAPSGTYTATVTFTAVAN